MKQKFIGSVSEKKFNEMLDDIVASADAASSRKGVKAFSYFPCTLPNTMVYEVSATELGSKVKKFITDIVALKPYYFEEKEYVKTYIASHINRALGILYDRNEEGEFNQDITEMEAFLTKRFQADRSLFDVAKEQKMGPKYP